MNAKRIGLVLFWVGAALLFTGSWLIMWWIAPIWSGSPPEQFEGTAMAAFGALFMAIAISAPLGILLAALGMLLYAEGEKPRTWQFSVLVAGLVLVAASMMFPATLGYYPVLFGISGGMILVLFFAAVWYWARRRRTFGGAAKTAADFQLVSYVFFLLTALLMCSLLGNPFSGLFFPEKVLEQQALPLHYAMGTKAVIYFALGWLFTFLRQRIYYKAAREARS
ncbi:MAG: hypothetical protein PVJ64_07200 [Gemmatimonadales bacterium]|jgi:hypothetical protein